jgi:acyl-CoA reductase-like NAD-dependent aldehyde dehydrogenase
VKNDFKLLVDGELIDGANSFDVINPATEEAFAQAPVPMRPF